MPKNRSGRVVFLLLVVMSLFIIGRNMVRRNLSTQLLSAIDANDLPAVRALLERGVDPGTPPKSMPPLSRAMQNLTMLSSRDGSQPDVLKQPRSAQDSTLSAEAIACLLIQHGADLQQLPVSPLQDPNTVSGRESYVNQACSSGNIAVLRCLLDRGAHANQACLNTALQYGQPRYSFRQNTASASVREADKIKDARRLEASQQMAKLLREHGVGPTPAQCIALNDCAALKATLEAGASPNALMNQSNTEAPLALAVRKGSVEMVNALLAHGAYVNWQPASGDSALNSAVQTGNLEMVKLLLAHGADVNQHGMYSGTPLETAAGKGNSEVVKLLLAQGAKLNDGNSSTPLQSALLYQRPQIVRLLLARGADVNHQPERGAQSTLAAAIQQLPEFVPELLKRGVDVNGGNSAPLLAAIRKRQTPLTQELLRRGANVNPVPPPPVPFRPGIGQQPVLSPQSKGMFPVFVGKDPAHPGRNIPYPFSPLMNAVCFAPECTDMLLQAGAKIGPDKQTVLAAAAKCGRVDLFGPMLAMGADANGVDAEGETALTQAISYAPTGLSILLAHGANPNFITPLKHTPLDLAAGKGNADGVRLLLVHGANINLCPPRGHTALYWAKKHNGNHLTHAVAKNGQTPPGVTPGSSNAEVIALLERAGAKEE